MPRSTETDDPRGGRPDDDLAIGWLDIDTRALHVCLEAGLSTVGELLTYYRTHGTFLGLKKCGMRTERVLLELCGKLERNQAPEQPPASGQISDSYGVPGLLSLRPRLTRPLLKLLGDHGVWSVGELRKLDVPAFVDAHRMKTEPAERLRTAHMIVNRAPEIAVRLVESYQTDAVLPAAGLRDDSVLPHDFVGALERVVLSLLAIERNPRAVAVVTRCMGLDGQTEPLSQIADSIGISRQRTHQIKIAFLKRIGRLLDGDGLDNPLRDCEPRYKACIARASKVLRPSLIMERDSYLTMIGEATGTAMTTRRAAVLTLLELRYGIRTIKWRRWLFMLGPEAPIRRFREVVNAVVDTLQTGVACTLAELTARVRRLTGDRGIPEAFIQAVAASLPDVAERPDGAFELRFGALYWPAKAYRVLHGRGEPMHYREIHEEIARRLAREGLGITGNFQSLRKVMSADSKLVAIGITGWWALAEWKLNSDTLTESIAHYIRSRGAPASVDDILEHIARTRPDIEAVCVRRILTRQLKHFARIADGRYILTEWSDSYELRRTRTVASPLPPQLLYDTLKQLFESRGFRPLSRTELCNAFREIGRPLSRNTVGSMMRKCAYVKETMHGNRCLYTFDQRAGRPRSARLQPRRSGGVQARITRAVNRQLLLCGGVAPLSEIVNILAAKGFRLPTIYRVISASPDYVKSKPDGRHVVLHWPPHS